MKNYKRITERNVPCSVSATRLFNGKHEQYYYSLRDIEDKIEDGEILSKKDCIDNNKINISGIIDMFVKKAKDLICERIITYPDETNESLKYGVNISKSRALNILDEVAESIKDDGR